MNAIITRLKLNIKILKTFGITYAFYDLFNSLFMEKGWIGHKLHKLKHEHIKRYIEKEYGELIEKYKKMKINDNCIGKNSSIFVFWWQGIDNAPEIVKKCIQSIKRHSNNRKVQIIDKNNYKEFVKIPDIIIKKFEEGNLSITNFADILRFNLLYENGGIWIDATVYLTDDLKNDISDRDFFSIHHNKFTDYHTCKGLWATSFLAAGKKSNLMKFIKDFFEQYMIKNDVFICYFLIDCLLAVAYEKIDAFREEIEEVPVNNEDYFELEKNLSNIYSKSALNQFKNTYIFKTTYKKHFELEKNKETTFYGAIMKNLI